MINFGRDIILYCCNTLIIIWSFRVLAPEQKIPVPRTVIAYVCLILLRLPQYFFVDVIQPAWLSSMVRFIPCVFFLRIGKGLDWKRCVYFSCLIWVGFSLCSSIFMAPVFNVTPLVRFPFTDSALANVLIGSAIRHGADFLVVTCMTRYIPMNRIRTIGPVRAVMMAVVILCELYIIQSLDAMQSAGLTGNVMEVTVYLILLQVFVAAGTCLFERYLIGNAERETMRLAELESRYRYEGLRERQLAESDVRRVHHDIKNHLLAIRRLSGDPEALERYLDTLIHRELAAIEGLFHTGSEILDGLLGEKAAQAGRNGVRLEAVLDIRPFPRMEDIDVCAIFGNILDNAIEASSQLADPGKKTISLKSTRAANQLIITCANFYSGQLRLSSGLPATTKADPLHHGIGLSSVRRSVEKYGGVLTLEATPECQLIVTILLPLEPPEAAQTK